MENKKKKRNFKSLKIDLESGEGTIDKGLVKLEDKNMGTMNFEREGKKEDCDEDKVIRIGFSQLDITEKDIEIKTNEEKSVLGAGVSGMVYRVKHRASGTLMAMKVVKLEQTTTTSTAQQLLKELEILNECNSPFIVSFYGAFCNIGVNINNGGGGGGGSNMVKIFMEYMDVGSFDRIYRKNGPIPVTVIGLMTYSVIQGLTYLYNTHRIMHRDIKPSNILLNSKGYIKLCDFSISKQMESNNSIANTFVGTAIYMAPERMQGAEYSVKSDVWSLGTTVLELALGRHPFGFQQTSIFEMMHYISTSEKLSILDPTKYEKNLCSFVDGCLAKDPNTRPTPNALLAHPFVLSHSDLYYKNTEKLTLLRNWLNSLIL